MACPYSSEDIKWTPPWASTFSTHVIWPRSQTDWAMFSFLPWIVQSVQMLFVTGGVTKQSCFLPHTRRDPSGHVSSHQAQPSLLGRKKDQVKFWTLVEAGTDVSEAPVVNRSSSTPEVSKNERGHLTWSAVVQIFLLCSRQHLESQVFPPRETT